MLKIGLTGGIGSGKTTVSNKFHSLFNIPVIDADEISKSLMTPNGAAYNEIIQAFGPQATLTSKEIDRKFLREQIFSNPSLRQTLEEIIHPKVRSEINKQLSKLSSGYCLIVIPLLIESKMDDMVDRILVIDTLKQLQVSRVCIRDNCSSEHVESILDNQISSTHRNHHADDIITNNNGIVELEAQIHQLHEKYLALSN